MTAGTAYCQETESKRLFGIVPNYRTTGMPVDYQPLTAEGKFHIAAQDTFDRGTVVLAALFAGQGQLTNSSPSFGQGTKGFAHYWATSYADYAMGNFMTEALYPTLLHQDPRYFRKGTGSGLARAGYAVKQIFWTHRDAGGTQFNYSEVVGNATAVAIGNAYYPDNRTAGEAARRLGTQLSVDTASNLLKEFWPDISRKFGRKRK